MIMQPIEDFGDDDDYETGNGTYKYLVYDRNHYFGLGPIPIVKPKLADTFGTIP